MFFKLFSVFIAILVIQSIDGVCVTSTTTATTTTTTTVRVSGDTSALNNELLRGKLKNMNIYNFKVKKYFYIASSRSNCDTVKAQFAIDNGANVNVVDETSLFPLFFGIIYLFIFKICPDLELNLFILILSFILKKHHTMAALTFQDY
jgi:hypothetical protein